MHAKKLNIVWPIVIWLAIGSLPASFATHWVLDNYLSQSTSYKAVLTTVLGFMLTLTGLSIMFRGHIEKFFNKFRNANVMDDMTADLRACEFSSKEQARLYYYYGHHFRCFRDLVFGWCRRFWHHGLSFSVSKSAHDSELLVQTWYMLCS